MITTDKHLLTLDNWCLLLKANKISPVTISVPHDGLITGDLLGFFIARKIGYSGRDRHVWPIAKDILINFPANALRGLMPRAFVDYNRAWPEAINYYPLTQNEAHTALDDERLVHVYKYYHDTLRQLIESSCEKFGQNNSLLIDLHGFKNQPPYAPEGGYDLIFGTGNRITIPHGDLDIRIAAFMRSRGYKVFLPESAMVGPIEDYFSADFTTRHYSERYDINVLQIEIAAKFRAPGASEIGQKLSKDISDFLVSCYI